MKKKTYEEPRMRICKMRQRARLLAGSNVNANMNETFEEKNWDN